jgi:ParB-like chromosome segregation protein Spo0J
MNAQVVEIIEVPLALVEEPAHVLRPVDRDTPKFKALVESMQTSGFHRDEPIQVTKSSAGTYVIAAKGMHRYNAASAAGLKNVWVAVLDRELTTSELIAAQVQAEATHTEARPAEFGRAVLAYMNEPENKGKTKVEIASAMGRADVGFLDKVLKLATLPEPVQELVDDNEISMGNGLALVALVRAGVALTDEIIAKAKVEDVPAFQALAATEVQKLRAAPRGKKEAPARLRKVEDVRAELKRATLDPSASPGYVAGLAFALRMDPVSAAAEGLAPAATGAEAEGAALRAEAAKARAALEAADVLAEAAKRRTAMLEHEVERLNREIDQRDSVIKALEKGRKPEA